MTDSRPLRVLFIAFSRSSLGHVTRMRTAARRFADAGHTVAVAAHEEVRHVIEHAGLQWIGIDEIGPAPAWRGMTDVESLRAFVRTRLASEEYLETSLRDELRAIDDFVPDAVVSDMRNTASVAASMRNVPSFTCHNLRLFQHPMHVVLPEIMGVLENMGVEREHHVPLGDVVLVPDLSLLDPLAEIPAETAALMTTLTSEIRHIGPLVPRELMEQPTRTERERLLNITLGGSGAGNKDLLRVVEAASGLGVRLAVTLGVEGPVGDELAAQVRAAAGDAEIEIANFRHDAVDLMSRATAAVVHGGHSSMIEGLLCATPLVFVSQSAEQRGNSVRVARLGFGEIVQERDPIEAVAEKIRSALNADREAHEAFASVLRSADGAGAMLDVVERAVAMHRATGGASAW